MRTPISFSSRSVTTLVAVATWLAPITEAAPVRVVGQGGNAELRRDGQPYFVRGAGGDLRAMESVKAAGGNSIRLWGDDDLGPKLDQAQELGLTVCVGFWVGQIRQGFQWSDARAVAQQRERLRATVARWKEHPAVLMWAIGNEMEDAEGQNLDVWKGVNDLAAMVKETDPNHPTMTVIAEIGGDKVRNVHQLCPAIDILGINSYGGATTVGSRYRELGGTKPYLLTEFGPPGIWEIAKNEWGAYPEPTSTEKTKIYRHAYESAVRGQPGRCLGSYVFYWGQKQEVTSSWFSMFLEDGSRLGPVDAISELWTGKAPANQCPIIEELAFKGPASGVAGAYLEARLRVVDPENDAVEVQWLLRAEAAKLGTGGDAEAAPRSFPEAIFRRTSDGTAVRLPDEPGLYRLFVSVRDEHGGAAAGNLSLRVVEPSER